MFIICLCVSCNSSPLSWLSWIVIYTSLKKSRSDALPINFISSVGFTEFDLDKLGIKKGGHRRKFLTKFRANEFASYKPPDVNKDAGSSDDGSDDDSDDSGSDDDSDESDSDSD